MQSINTAAVRLDTFLRRQQAAAHSSEYGSELQMTSRVWVP